MTEDFVYRQPSRRPVIWAITAAFAFMLLLLVLSGAQWVFFVPVGVGASMMLFLLLKNPINGLVIRDGQLVLSAWRRPNPIALRDIATIEIIDWSDSSDLKIHLKSGEKIEAFPGDIPPREPFRVALARWDVELIKS